MKKTITAIVWDDEPKTDLSLEIKSSDMCGWASIRLVSAICNKNIEKLAGVTSAITNNYTETEIKQIWRHCKSLLTDEEIIWLESNLKQLLTERFN